MAEQKKKTARDRSDLFHQEFAEKVIAMLEAGTSPLQTPWTPSRRTMPFNPETGTVYKGINRIGLMMSGYDDPRWMTYQQAQAAGYQVRRGEKGTRIAHYKWAVEQDRLDDSGRPVLDGNGQPEKVTIRLQRPIVSIYSVFNVAQIDGDIPPLPKEPGYAWEPQRRAESILAASGAVIIHDQTDGAFYKPFTDEIHLPPRERFDAPDKYYATALHELGHWTGHASRLDRHAGAFGTASYAREELRAEIATWMIGEEIGVGHDPGDHAAYVQSWIAALRDDPSEIARACRDAEDILGYLLDLERDYGAELADPDRVTPEPEANAPDQAMPEGEANAPTEQASAEPEPGSARAALDPERAAVRDGLEPAKIWLDVPYREKEQAKREGAQWDKAAKRWYAREGADLDRLAAWMPKEVRPDMPPVMATEKTWLAVPYGEKEQAKRLGARWDGKARSWYAPEGVDLGKLGRWVPDRNQEAERMWAGRSTLSPEAEFAQKLEELGLDLKGQPPVLDGKPHRVPVLSKNGRGLDGSYCLYGDGRPAGWAQNHVSGVYMKLVATGARLSPEELARQRAAFAARKAEHERARRERSAEAARAAAGRFAEGHAVTEHPYLAAKGVPPLGPVRELDGKLLIPIRDAEGNFRGVQSIDGDGEKRFTPGMEKKGGFCLLERDEKNFNGGEIVLCEGYATGASLALATGKPVAVAFDAGNLGTVAEALREKFPRMAITICADNDHATERDGKPWNPGVEKAKAAARKVHGKVIVPSFSEAEKARKLTDFNDLHKARGLGAVRSQLSKEQDMER